jgi:hypothetical protein
VREGEGNGWEEREEKGESVCSKVGAAFHLTEDMRRVLLSGSGALL